MGVCIPNIKLPEKCSKCRDTGLKFAIDALGLKCPERKEIWGPTEAELKGIRRSDCPLVPVPEHGRLIDAEKIGLTDFEIIMCNGNYKEALKMLLDKIKTAPTIIPAEPEEVRAADCVPCGYSRPYEGNAGDRKGRPYEEE